MTHSREINKFKTTYSFGTDTISVSLIKYIYKILAPHLCVLIKHSFENKNFLVLMSLFISPMYKSGDYTLLTNYRPIIAMKSSVSKVAYIL